jgi:hypothetical protein
MTTESSKRTVNGGQVGLLKLVSHLFLFLLAGWGRVLRSSVSTSLMFFFAICLFLPFLLGAFAGETHLTHIRPRHRHRARLVSRTSGNFSETYTMTDYYHGSAFLTCVVPLSQDTPHICSSREWDFFTEDDPTHGNVQYQSGPNATSKGLAFVQDDGTTVLAVDDKTVLPVGGKRDSSVFEPCQLLGFDFLSKPFSVRISTKKKFNGGLFIADFFTMPHGCSVWPAYWWVDVTSEFTLDSLIIEL